MGLFCISQKDTPDDQLKAALANLEMFNDHLNLGDDPRDIYGNRIPLYLLELVEGQIKKTLNILSERTPD